MPEEQVIDKTQEFDVKAYLDDTNKAQEAARKGEAVPVKEEPKPKVEAKPIEEHVSRADRRAQNKLREEIGELRGRLAAYEEMGVNRPKEAAAEVKSDDPEPKREEFDSDEKFQRAIGRWEGRQGAKEIVSTAVETTRQEEEQATLQAHFKAMDAKAIADQKLIPGWEKDAEAAQEAADADETLQFGQATQPVFMGLLAASDVRSFVLNHFCKDEASLRKILALADVKDMPQRKEFKSGYEFNSALGRWAGPQIEAFRRLEGRIEKMYDTSKPLDKDPEKKLSAAERDALKPKPSESAVPRGGSGLDGTTPMVLADGRTINPAWLAKRNAEVGARP